MNLTRRFSSVALVLLLVSAQANARDLKLAFGFGPTHAGQTAMEALSKSLKEKTSGELEGKIFPSSLLGPTQMFAGVRDGIVDVGWSLLSLANTEFPESQLAANLAMLGTNGYAMAAAMTEYNFSCAECLAERLRNNHVYLGSASTGVYWILSTKKIATLDEFKGKKLRSAAPPWGRWANHVGAASVSIPGNEVFEAVSQGTVDGAMQAATELSSLRLIDVVKHITLNVPGGTFHGIDTNNVNRNTWRSLTVPQRQAFIDAAALSSATGTWRFVNEITKNMDEAKKRGIQVHQPSADVLARSKSFQDVEVAAVVQEAEKRHGTKNAAEKAARFRQLVEKWEKLVPESANWEPNALAEVFRREIFSKVDAKTYGL